MKWARFPASQNTWEPEENLKCPELLQRFKDNSVLNKKRKSSRLSGTTTSPDGKHAKERVISPSPSPKKSASDVATGEWERKVDRIDTVERRHHKLYVSVIW